MKRRRRRNPLDPFATTAGRPAMVPSAGGPLSRNEKIALGGAAALGALSLYLFFRKVSGGPGPSSSAPPRATGGGYRPPMPAAPPASSGPSGPPSAWHDTAVPWDAGSGDEAPVPPDQYDHSTGSADAGSTSPYSHN